MVITLQSNAQHIKSPSTLYIDNASAIQVAKNPEHQSTMKHVHRNRRGRYKSTTCTWHRNVADIFAKPLGPTKFRLCCNLLGLHG